MHTKLTQFYVKHYFEGVFPQKEGIKHEVFKKVVGKERDTEWDIWLAVGSQMCA